MTKVLVTRPVKIEVHRGETKQTYTIIPGAVGDLVKEEGHGKFTSYTVRFPGSTRVFTLFPEEVTLIIMEEVDT